MASSYNAFSGMPPLAPPLAPFHQSYGGHIPQGLMVAQQQQHQQQYRPQQQPHQQYAVSPSPAGSSSSHHHNSNAQQLQQNFPPSSSSLHHRAASQSQQSAMGGGGPSSSTAAAQQRAQIEATVKALVDKNKALEAEATSKMSAADDEIERLQREVASLRQQNMQYQSGSSSNAEAIAALQGQSEEGKRMAADLLRENEGILSRQSVLERETEQLKGLLDAAYRNEEEVRAGYDDVCDKLAKADRHIRQLCDEAAEKSLGYAAMKSEAEEARELKENMQKLKNELLTHVVKSLFAMAEEAELLMVESDELSIRTRLALSTAPSSSSSSAALNNIMDFEHHLLQSQLDKLKVTKAALRATFHHKQNPYNHMDVVGGGAAGDPNQSASANANAAAMALAMDVPLRCLPEGIRTLQQLSQLMDGNEAMIVSVGTSIVDALALVRDDIAVTVRAVDEEGSTKRIAMGRHFKSLEEAVQSERAHTKQLLSELDAQSVQLKHMEDERDALKKTLSEMDKFMQEATHLSETSAQRSASYVEDKMRAERELKECRETIASLQTEMNKQTAMIGKLTTDLEQWRFTAQQREGEVSTADHANRRSIEAIAELKRETEALQAALRTQRSVTDEANDRANKIEVENATLRKQILENETQMRILQSKVKSVEGELRYARDEASEAQKRADRLLTAPRGSVAPVAAALSSSYSVARTTSVAPNTTAAAGVGGRPPLLPLTSSSAVGGGVSGLNASAALLHSPPPSHHHAVGAAQSPAVARPLTYGGGGNAADGTQLSMMGTSTSAAAVDSQVAATSENLTKYDEWESKLSGLLQRAQPRRAD